MYCKRHRTFGLPILFTHLIRTVCAHICFFKCNFLSPKLAAWIFFVHSHGFCTLDFRAASSSVSQIHIGESCPAEGDSSLNRMSSDEHHQLPQASNAAGFKSMPTMDVNEQTADEILQNLPALTPNINGELLSNSCHDPAVKEEPTGPVLLARPNICQIQQKHYPAHWSAEAVAEALEVS